MPQMHGRRTGVIRTPAEGYACLRLARNAFHDTEWQI